MADSDSTIATLREKQMEKSLLTVGELRRSMAALHDDCIVEVSVGRDGYGQGIRAEANSDGDGSWLTICVDP